jgi:catechol 2,3-dioxygenase-like lactoylglutathione lyase family enzyme
MKNLVALAGALAIGVSFPAAAQQASVLRGVKIAVQDYERTTRFYTLLGMTAGTKFNPMEWELRWADPAQGSPIIMVHDDSGRMRVVKGGATLIISVADVSATVARLKAAGFPVSGEPHTNARAVLMVVPDPDGNSIELVSRPPSSGATAGH